MKKSKHFKIHELVCLDIYNRDKELAWRYFRPELIDFIDWLRERVDKPIYINNWQWGGNKTQRGYRCNLCPLVKNKNILYASAHMLGAGVDFNVKNVHPNDVREYLKDNIHEFFNDNPCYIRKCRIESNILAPTWVHIDFFEHPNDGIIYEF